MQCISSKYGYLKLVPLFWENLFMIHVGDILLFAEQTTLRTGYWVFEAKNKAWKCLRGTRTNTDAWLTLSAPLTNHFPDVANANRGAWVTSTTEMFPSILHSLVMWQNYTHFFIAIFGHCTSFKNTDDTCWRWNERWVDQSAIIKMCFEWSYWPRTMTIHRQQVSLSSFICYIRRNEIFLKNDRFSYVRFYLM